MFRRKEENSLFEDMDGEVMQHESEQESEENTARASKSSASSSSSGLSSIYPGQPASNRSSTPYSNESRTASTPAQAGSTANFRANPSPVETTRGRVTENKATIGSFTPPAAANASQDKSSNKESKRILTVGEDILLKGEIATCDRLIIEGEVDASLNDVHTVEIAESGSFKGTAEIEYAEISGLFEGELIVKNRLVIYSTGRVCGNITYGEIEIQRGGEMTGEINTTASVKTNNKVKSKEKDAA